MVIEAKAIQYLQIFPSMHSHNEGIVLLWGDFRDYFVAIANEIYVAIFMYLRLLRASLLESA